MKELSIEEKTTRYDEALKAAIVAHKDEDKHLKATLERIFPELKESEDERMRNAAINACKYMVDNFENSTKQYKDAIAWLEKQGEHAKFRDSIQVGDKVTRNEDGVLVNLSQLKRVAKKDEKQGEQKPADNKGMNIDEAFINALGTMLNDGLPDRYLVSEERIKESAELLFSIARKQLKNEMQVWSEEDENILNTIINHFKVDIECTDEDDMVRWLKSLKDRVQPKQEWGEEDKNMLQSILDEYKSMPTEKRNWLKSLKPQNRWKPSDEQMDNK